MGNRNLIHLFGIIHKIFEYLNKKCLKDQTPQQYNDQEYTNQIRGNTDQIWVNTVQMLRKYNTNLRKYNLNTNHIRADEKYEAGGYEDGGGHREEH